MTTSFIQRGDVTLSFEDVGHGPSVLFQHGLGADMAQVAEVFPDEPPARRITLECRAQGWSDVGPFADLSIRTFSEDAAFLVDSLKLDRAIVGGISMGATIALRLAVTRPDLVAGLVLARPAWLFRRAPDNMQPFAMVGELLATFDRRAARSLFMDSETGARLAREAPDNLASLMRFFDHKVPEPISALLKAIAADGPGVSEPDVARIQVPTLVIGNGQDFVHPLEYAEQLAAVIPGARMVKITSKVVDKTRYVAEFRSALSTFLSSL